MKNHHLKTILLTILIGGQLFFFGCAHYSREQTADNSKQIQNELTQPANKESNAAPERKPLRKSGWFNRKPSTVPQANAPETKQAPIKIKPSRKLRWFGWLRRPAKTDQTKTAEGSSIESLKTKNSTSTRKNGEEAQSLQAPSVNNINSTNEKTAEATTNYIHIMETASNPLIKPGHVLSVVVMTDGQRDVNEVGRRVSSTGELSLPLVGSIKVSNMTIPQLTEVLREKFKSYIRDPMVDVVFVVDDISGAVSPWGSVTVLGCVNQPGRINIPPTQDLTVSMAIQLAGGFDDSAKDTAIKVTRREPSGELTSTDINLRDTAAKGKVDNDIILSPGDVIFVPMRVF